MRRMQGECRRHMRSGLRIPVVLRYLDQVCNTDILNISASGIGLKNPGETLIQFGEKVDITLRNRPSMTLEATVAYVGKSRIGLNFNRPSLSEQELRNVYRCAPWWQQLSLQIKRLVWRIGRRSAVFLTNTLLRPLILKWVRPQFIFAAYGNERQASTYFSPTLARWMPLNLILGYIRHKEVRGLLVAPQYLENELQTDARKMREYIERLPTDFHTAKVIALAGRLPVFANRAGIELSPQLVEGSRGTRYMIWDIARKLRARPELAQYNSIVVLGGAGRIGSAVCEDITKIYSQVVAFDPRYEAEEERRTEWGVVLRTSNPTRLRNQHLYIALTQQGDEILDIHQYLPSGSLIADDTHPCISFDGREVLETYDIAVEKTVLSHDEFLMWPRMPSWNNRDIPGCLVEALVLLHHPESMNSSFAEFCENAERLGFAGRLVRPLDE